MFKGYINIVNKFQNFIEIIHIKYYCILIFAFACEAIWKFLQNYINYRPNTHFSYKLHINRILLM
jgi:hypothetical protein